MTGLCERLRAKIAEQRERRGDIIDYGEPDDELVEALARIGALEAALERAVDALDGFKVSPVGGTAKMRALLSDSTQ